MNQAQEELNSFRDFTAKAFIKAISLAKSKDELENLKRLRVELLTKIECRIYEVSK